MKELQPTHNSLDKTIYNLIVPADRRTLEMRNSVDYVGNDSDSNSDVDRFGGIKKQPDMQTLIDKWEGFAEVDIYSTFKGDDTIIYDDDYGIGSSFDIQRQRQSFIQSQSQIVNPTSI